MINHKQQQLIDELIQSIKERFPEVELIKVIESPEDPSDLWVYVTAPRAEEREFELRDFTSEKSSDILQDYGYLILVMPRRQEQVARMDIVE
jgi:hypothetical protein